MLRTPVTYPGYKTILARRFFPSLSLLKDLFYKYTTVCLTFDVMYFSKQPNTLQGGFKSKELHLKYDYV